MVRINGVGANALGFGSEIYTKRQCIDNSEIYISSKLSKLYKQAVADSFVNKKLNEIRKFAKRNSKQGNDGTDLIA